MTPGVTPGMPDGEAMWQQIASAAANSLPPVRHPQYIEGTLYVTPEQFEALRESSQRPVYDPLTEARLLEALEIPVQVIRDDEIVTLPSGKSLTYLKSLASLAIFDKRLLP